MGICFGGQFWKWMWKNDSLGSEIGPGEPSGRPYEEFPEVPLPLGLSVVCPKGHFSHNSYDTWR